MEKNKETHISVLRPTHEKLKAIADSERRTLRSVIDKLVNDAYIKLKG